MTSLSVDHIAYREHVANIIRAETNCSYVMADRAAEAIANLSAGPAPVTGVTDEEVEAALEAAKQAFNHGDPADKRGQIRAALLAAARARPARNWPLDADERAELERPAPAAEGEVEALCQRFHRQPAAEKDDFAIDNGIVWKIVDGKRVTMMLGEQTLLIQRLQAERDGLQRAFALADDIKTKAQVERDEARKKLRRAQLTSPKASEEEVERLRALVKELADDLEAELNARYDKTLDYPSQRLKYDRDMAPVRAARTLRLAPEQNVRKAPNAS